MNKNQKASLIVGVLLLILSALFPVWSIKMYGIEIRTTRALLYSSGGSVLGTSLGTTDLNIKPDYARMAVEWTLIVLVTAVSIVLFKEKNK